MARANKLETTTFDQLLAVAAVVIVIVQPFLEKTRLSAALSGLLLFLVIIRPLTRLPSVIGSRGHQWLVACGSMVVILIWVASIWPKTLPPRSDLRIEKEVFQPFQAGVKPHLDMQIFDDSPYPIQAYHAGLISVYDSLPDMKQLLATEKELWAKLEDQVAKDRKVTAEQFYAIQITPRVDMVVPGEGAPLSESVAQALQKDNGPAFVFAMSIFLYRDDSGEYGIESCTYTQGGHSMLKQCEIGHNLPLKYRPDHWWSK